MPIDLEEMLAPGSAAVLTMEVQRSVVGDLSMLPDLKDAAAKVGLLDHIGQLLGGARSTGVPVVHCTVGADAVPSAPPNYPGASALAKRRESPEVRAAGSEAVDGVDRRSDLVVERHHGVSPFTGTELDSVLRRLGARTVVACGVSLNVGIVGLTVEAVSLGYRVVVATDAVVGVPVEYGQAVLNNTLPFLATRLTVAELCAIWATLR
ncbi:MAG TPA: cysteine hydrolase family protein [Acidimicrobiales bacterium]|nr:cysteine hydrolase family protein [Acidimicrobiales bacterium]